MLSKTVTSCVFAAALALLGAAHAQYPDLPHLHSVEQAEQERDAASLAQQALERDYQQQQRECLSRFFVARCQEQARNAYNEDMAKQSLKQRQAELYLRRSASAERAQLREQDAREREEEKKRIIQQAEEAPVEQALPAESALPAPDLAPLPLPAPSTLPDPRQAGSGLSDAQRAENIEAYQRRQQEAAEHAARVEEKRLETELRREQRREEREALAERLKKLQQERTPR